MPPTQTHAHTHARTHVHTYTRTRTQVPLLHTLRTHTHTHMYTHTDFRVTCVRIRAPLPQLAIHSFLDSGVSDARHIELPTADPSTVEPQQPERSSTLFNRPWVATAVDRYIATHEH